MEVRGSGRGGDSRTTLGDMLRYVGVEAAAGLWEREVVLPYWCRATFRFAFGWMVFRALLYPVPAFGRDLLLNRIIYCLRVDLTMKYLIGRTGKIERGWR